jgi:hypothetical protein
LRKVDWMRLCLLMAAVIALAACQHESLATRHGSPLHTYKCGGGKTFQVRQIISGEVEVTAGGQTRDLTDANGDLTPNGPRMTPIDEPTRLTGMPGGPYEACIMDDGDA